MKIKLLFKEQEKAPLLQDVSSLLYDFEPLYDFCLVTSSKEYSGYKFSQSFWYRKGRDIEDVHKLRASKISKESPLSIELLLTESLAVLGAAWVLIQAIEKIYNLRLNRQKKVLEIKRLRLEIAKLEDEMSSKELEHTLRNERNNTTFRIIAKRLETSSIKLEDFEIEIESQDDKKVTFT